MLKNILNMLKSALTLLLSLADLYSTLPNIYDDAFLQKWLTALAVNYFCIKASS